jgi:hypothetical protein
MSHFSRVRTQLRNLNTVQQALEALGYSVKSGRVRGYRGQEADADLVIDVGGSYDIGFRREGENVVMVGDFWGLKVDRTTFLNQVSQKYAYLTVLEQTQADGWSKVIEEVREDGSIRLVVQRWA